MKRVIGIVLIVMLMINLSSCGLFHREGKDSPEEAATTFVKATMAADLEMFETCVHEKLLTSSLDWLGTPGVPTVELQNLVVKDVEYTPENAMKRVREQWKKETGLDVEALARVTMTVQYFEYNDRGHPSQTIEIKCITYCVEDRWYAWGWS